jgi:ATP-grasp domain, R2K clade family 3
MIFYLQDSSSFASMDNNLRPLVDALTELHIPFQGIGLVPFTHEITGLDSPQHPCFFYGSTSLIEKVARTPELCSGVFYDVAWFDSQLWSANRTDMLNQDIHLMTVGELKASWPTEVKFIRPREVKTFVGQVIEPEEAATWAEENYLLKDDTELYMSDVHRIEREWRFFIIGGNIVAGSLYKRWGFLTIREPIDSAIRAQAEKMAATWLPSQNIVMDIAHLRDGTFRVVEFNAVNSSGLYRSDPHEIVKAILNHHTS